jgi:hypothetical protein
MQLFYGFVRGIDGYLAVVSFLMPVAFHKLGVVQLNPARDSAVVLQ